MNKIVQIVPKSVISLFIFSLLFTLSAPSAFADFDITTVRGKVLGPDNKPLKHAKVVVTCGGDTEKDKTNGDGKYSVKFRGRHTCEAGDTATITVSKDGVTGSTTGIVQEKKNGRFVDRNFLIAPNITVPEFGLMTGSITALASAGLFLKMRRRS